MNCEQGEGDKRDKLKVLWVKIEKGKEGWIIVSVYSTIKRGGEERVWELLRGCLGNFRKGKRAVVIGYLNARVGDTARNEITILCIQRP